jgi:hypothetical protein
MALFLIFSILEYTSFENIKEFCLSIEGLKFILLAHNARINIIVIMINNSIRENHLLFFFIKNFANK